MNETLKNVTFAFASAVFLFIITAVLITRVFEFSSYNELRISIEDKLEKNDLIAEAMLSSLEQIATLSTRTEFGKLADPIYKKSEGLFTRAFVVRVDGSILSHSEDSEVTRLNGNIGADEFLYNVEEIYYSVKAGISGTVVRDYHLIDVKQPFDVATVELLKNLVNSKIDRNALLYSRRVVLKDRTLSSANIIISKSAIYSEIQRKLDEISRVKLLIIVSSFLLSVIFGILIYVLIGKNSKRNVVQLPDSYIQPEISPSEVQIVEEIRSPIQIREEPVVHHRSSQVNPVIQDAIPIRRRRS
jgi:hypothetical protein